ncbi:hypothetical protein D7Z26_06325 [Cohnella endophytica]|uniref:Copper amine oxidase-like N-terminal domain-containing protein n=1 Tax=Cohnella endophytica TaxID=2419778 RepID=A0A494Y0F9_9BACL|nr:hypothetical protein [Cohnella endophytica]RKP56249.1 hypothetical protein D7Z26_06325 [Cohnella endophytica]
MKNKKMLVLMLLVSFMLGATSVSAGTYVENIKATINYAITTVVMGKSFAPKDDKGKEVRPISYNGKVYVPAVQIANSLGFAAKFDPKTNKLSIGTTDSKTDLIKGHYFDKNYTQGLPTTDADLLTANGKTYKSGWFIQLQTGFISQNIYFDTNNKFQKLSFKSVVKSGEEPMIVTIEDRDTGLVFKSIKIDINSGVISGGIDIGGVKNVRISVSGSGNQLKFTKDSPGELIIADLFAY